MSDTEEESLVDRRSGGLPSHHGRPTKPPPPSSRRRGWLLRAPRCYSVVFHEQSCSLDKDVRQRCPSLRAPPWSHSEALGASGVVSAHPFTSRIVVRGSRPDPRGRQTAPATTPES